MNATAARTARIATGLAAVTMAAFTALGLGAGIAAAHDGPTAGLMVAAMPAHAIPCDFKNPGPSDPDPHDGPDDLALPFPSPHPDPDPAGPTGIAPLPPTPEVNPDLAGAPSVLVAEPHLVKPPNPGVLEGLPTSPPPDDDCGFPPGDPGDDNPGDDPGENPGEDPGDDDPTGDPTDEPGDDPTDEPPTAGDDTLAYTGFGAGMLTAAGITLAGAGVFALLLARMVQRRTRRS